VDLASRSDAGTGSAERAPTCGSGRAKHRFGLDRPPLAPQDEREATPAAQLQRLIAAGEIAEVTRRLSHPYILTGEVIAGDARGRQLGFPTANMRPDPQKPLPAHGIYAVRVALPGEPQPIHPAVTSVGVRPTLGEALQPLIEP